MKEKQIDINPYKTLKSLVEVTTSQIGKDFLKVVCKELKKLIHADLIFILKPIKNNTSIKILSSTSKLIPNNFKLINTPCKLVYDNKIHKSVLNIPNCFEGSIGEDFKSFYAIPLTNLKDKCVGHIAIFFKNKRVIKKDLEDIILLFAKRIEVEYTRELLEKENRKIHKKLKKLSITDSLTRIYNRRYFEIFANDILNQVKRLNINATLSFIDIDDFKKINDKFGHKIGDRVLIYLSHILLNNARKGVEHVFRVGGEEFAIVSINTTKDESVTYFQRVNEALKKTPFDENISLTLSIGIDKFNVKDTSIDEAYKRADDKMYKAKNKGKDSIVC